MKFNRYLPLGVAALGAAGFGLRKALYALALDGKNLLVPHPLTWLLWLVTAAAAVLVLLGLRGRKPAAPGKWSAAFSLIAAAGIGLTVLLSDPPGAGTLGLIWKILAVMSFAALGVTAKCRWEGKQPFFLLYAAVCIFFAVHMVSCYQGWSSNPQIQDYVFSLLAGVGLMLFAYQQTACAVGAGRDRLRQGLGLISGFCAIVALSGTGYPLLYAACGIWALTECCHEA